MEVNPSFPARTVPEFIAYAKANPRKIMMASAGPGSAAGLYGELFKSIAGGDFAAVNFGGRPASQSAFFAGPAARVFEPPVLSCGLIPGSQTWTVLLCTWKR